MILQVTMWITTFHPLWLVNLTPLRKSPPTEIATALIYKGLWIPIGFSLDFWPNIKPLWIWGVGSPVMNGWDGGWGEKLKGGRKVLNSTLKILEAYTFFKSKWWFLSVFLPPHQKKARKTHPLWWWRWLVRRCWRPVVTSLGLNWSF